MSGEPSRTARCCCGACSIALRGEPTLNAICHCSSCKKRTGSAFGWSAYFPDAQVVDKTGELNQYAKSGDAGYERSFCAQCGTTLFWKSYALLPDQTGVAGGCFTDDPLPPPSFSAQDSTRCAWVTLPDDSTRV